MINISKISRIFFIGCIMQLFSLLPLTGIWSPPDIVSVPGDRVDSAYGCVLDTNILKNGVAIWGAPPGFRTDIQASFYTFGVGWSEPVIISSLAIIPGTPGKVFISQGDPSIAMNNLNYCVGVWEGSEYIIEEGENIQGVYAAERNPDGSWTPHQRVCNLNLDPYFFASNINCAVNDSGLAVAAWRESRRDNGINIIDYIMISFLQQGGSWSTPFQIADLAGSSIINRDSTPSVAMDAKGNVVVTFRYVSNNTSLIGAATYSAATNTWSPFVTLGPNGNKDFTFEDLPKAAINPDDNGNAIVVWNWRDITGDPQIVFSSSFTNGVWGPAVIVGINPYSGSVLRKANVVMDGLGNATAIWQQSTDTTEVISSSLPFGGSWSIPVVISTTPGANVLKLLFVERPIAVNLNGDVMVIYGGDDDSIYSVTKPFGGPWLEPEFISSNEVYPAQFSSTLYNIGIESCGFALSLWEARTQTGNIFQVWSSVHSNDVLIPPCNFTGTQCREKMATQSLCINTLTWSNCDQGCALAYRLYRNNVLIATIPPTGPFIFSEPVRCKETNTYCLTSINIFGVESPPACVVLR